MLSRILPPSITLAAVVFVRGLLDIRVWVLREVVVVVRGNSEVKAVVLQWCKAKRGNSFLIA